MRTAVRTDPALIRQVLADADATSQYAAGRKHGLTPRTINRWRTRRADEGPGWPTDQDIADWRADHAQHVERRARDAARSVSYRNAVYLNRGNLQVPAHGTTRRLQALFALGHTTCDLAERLNVSTSRVGHLLNGYFPTVFPTTAAAVADLYTDLSMVVPVDDGPKGRGRVHVHARARRMARQRGYFPPFAWENIDDPDETPTRGEPDQRDEDDVDEVVVERVLAGEYRLAKGTTRAEKEAIVAGWMATGRAEKTLCNQLGWRQGRYRPQLDTKAG